MRTKPSYGKSSRAEYDVDRNKVGRRSSRNMVVQCLIGPLAIHVDTTLFKRLYHLIRHFRQDRLTRNSMKRVRERKSQIDGEERRSLFRRGRFRGVGRWGGWGSGGVG